MNKDIALDGSATGPQLVVETKLMQNYRVVSAANPGSEVCAVANSQGQVEMFTRDSKGAVWRYYPDPDSSTGYTGVKVEGLEVDVLAAGLDTQGRIVVFAAKGAELSYIRETGQPDAPWSKPEPVAIPGPDKNKIVRLVVKRLTASGSPGWLGLCIVFEVHPSHGFTTYQVGDCLWGVSTVAVHKDYFASSQWAWMGFTVLSYGYGCFAQRGLAWYPVGGGPSSVEPVANTITPIDLDSLFDAQGNSVAFAVHTDGNLYRLNRNSAHSYSWLALSQHISFRQVQLAADDQGRVHVLAVADNNQLYHLQPEPLSPSGYSSPNAIHANVARIGVASNDAGSVDIFAIGTVHGSLTHLFLERFTGDWVAETVAVPTAGEVEEYFAYSSDVTVYDSNGAPLPNKPVSIWTVADSRITANGATYFVGPQRPARLSTNSAGMLSLGQETGKLGICAFQLNIPSVMLPKDVLVIEQSGNMQKYLGEVTWTDLMEAKDAAGNPLLPGNRRNESDTRQLAAALNSSMALAGGRLLSSSSLFSRQGPRPGVWMATEGSRQPGRIEQPPAAHWQLTMGAQGFSYQTLTSDEAQAILARKQPLLAATRAALGDTWWDDLGDFLAGVVEGIVNVVNAVVTTVGNGIKAVFEFVMDGVHRVFETVVGWVEQAFDMVQIIFADCAVYFEKLVGWLGEVFGWEDILRSQDALKYTINQLLEFLPLAVPALKNRVDARFATIQQELPGLFNWVIEKIGGTTTLSAYEKSSQPANPRFANAASNNFLFNSLIDNGAGARIDLSLSQALDGDLWDSFIQKLTALTKDTEASTAFTEALTYFENIGKNPGSFFSMAISGLIKCLQGVVQTLVSGAQAVVDLLFDCVASLMTAVKELFNKEWDIPFLSEFYAWLTKGEKLSAVSLVSLIIAAPVTVLYKLTNDARSAPFPTADSVAAFKALFSVQTLLDALRLQLPPLHEIDYTSASQAAKECGAGDQYWGEHRHGSLRSAMGHQGPKSYRS